MRVKRDFERIYRLEADPWSIGAADDPRYELYRELLLSRVRGDRILDIGCGLGAFLARFVDEFDALVGVETASEAVERGRLLHPEIEFVHASAGQIASTALDVQSFDAIVLSDVLYYLRRRDRGRVLAWTARHLNPGGHALVAGWCPGGRYFEPDELRALVRRWLRIVDDVTLASGHVALITRPKRRLAAFAGAPIAGASAVRSDGNVDRLAEGALAALPREPSPERLRLERRLRWLPPLRRRSSPTGDELVAVIGPRTDAAARALERRGFTIVSAERLAAEAAGS
jgi:SAM-dependent methyltransferase